MGKTNKKTSKIKICPLCERPYKVGNSACKNCKEKILEIEKRANCKYRLSIAKINSLRNIYKQNDILEYLLNNPNLVYTKIDKTNSIKWLKYRRFCLREQIKNKDYKNIPLYIKQFFAKNEKLGFINIAGNKEAPSIVFICKKCNEEYIMRFSNIKNGTSHKCDANISSGEFLVKEYFNKNKYKYKTQFDTLSCKNPKTGRILPYDFELIDYKVLIEVQGEQHSKYIPCFHGCLENFQYQMYKDKIKKEFADKKGYKLIYLYYRDFEDEKYKKIIENQLLK